MNRYLNKMEVAFVKLPKCFRNTGRGAPLSWNRVAVGVSVGVGMGILCLVEVVIKMAVVRSRGSSRTRGMGILVTKLPFFVVRGGRSLGNLVDFEVVTWWWREGPFLLRLLVGLLLLEQLESGATPPRTPAAAVVVGGNNILVVAFGVGSHVRDLEAVVSYFEGALHHHLTG